MKTLFLNHRASLEFESVEEIQKLETGIGIIGLTETDKIWGFKWFLITKLDLRLEFALQVARQALEQSLLSELEEKDEAFLTGADATLDLCALGEKQEFWNERTIGSQNRLHKPLLSWKLQLVKSFKDFRELKELTVKLLEERDGKSA